MIPPRETSSATTHADVVVPVAMASAKESSRRTSRVLWILLGAVVLASCVSAGLAISNMLAYNRDVSALSEQVRDLGGQPVTTVSTSAPGARGLAGEPGSPGAQGDRGDTGQPGRGFPGQPGATGSEGVPGVPGQSGAPGQSGVPGQDGVRGETGAPGDAGQQGNAGERGVPGQRGAPGATGSQGERGEPGPAPTQDQIDDAVARYCAARGDCQGPPGPSGPPGEPGTSTEPVPQPDTSGTP